LTDSHVELSQDWDLEIRAMYEPGRILATTIADRDATWRGYGCRLIVPHMGTRWYVEPPRPRPFVEVASSAGTVVSRDLFRTIGGYDRGMIGYGGFEPEFSVRAWRSGAEIVVAPTIEVRHRFKSPSERVAAVREARTNMVHNCVRFGIVHLPEVMILEMVRLHACEYPNHIHDALRMLEAHAAWQRRETLNKRLTYSFEWFVERFGLRDQIGDAIPIGVEA
jgi:hypothetical protein